MAEQLASGNSTTLQLDESDYVSITGNALVIASGPSASVNTTNAGTVVYGPYAGGASMRIVATGAVSYTLTQPTCSPVVQISQTGAITDPAAAGAIARTISKSSEYEQTWYDTGGTGGPVQVYENDRSLYQFAQDTTDVNRVICIDPVNGSDAGDGTPSSPKKTFNPSAWTGSVTNYQGGDLAAFKRGTTYLHNTGNPIIYNGTNRHIGAYGDPSLPRPVIGSTHLEVAGPYIVSMNAEHCSFSDVDIDASHQVSRSGLVITNESREQDLYSVIVQNSRITGVTSTLSGSYPSIAATTRCGIRVMGNGQTATRASAYNVLYDIDVINVEVEGAGAGSFHSAGCVGKLINGVPHGVRFRNCKSIGPGTQADALGFSSFSMRVLRDLYPIYTLASGTVYYFATNVASIFGAGISVPDVEKLYQRVPGATYYLRKNTATPTTPAVGEFGFDVATQRVYVNVGVALPTSNNTTYFVDLTTYAVKYITYDGCLAKGTKWPGTTSVHEGHGFAFDDFTSESIVMNCESINNDGMGISFNRGTGNWAINNRMYGNKYGSMGGQTLGARVWGNWCEENSRSGVSGANSVVALIPPVYAFSDMPNRLGGFRRLAYTGADASGFLVEGSANFNAPANLFDNSVVVPGVGGVTAGLVLARGLLSPGNEGRLIRSPKWVGM